MVSGRTLVVAAADDDEEEDDDISWPSTWITSCTLPMRANTASTMLYDSRSGSTLTRSRIVRRKASALAGCLAATYTRSIALQMSTSGRTPVNERGDVGDAAVADLDDATPDSRVDVKSAFNVEEDADGIDDDDDDADDADEEGAVGGMSLTSSLNSASALGISDERR